CGRYHMRRRCASLPARAGTRTPPIAQLARGTEMPKNGRFMVGLVGVALAVTYLVWTGVSETMVYYLTPTELIAKVGADPTFHDVGVKVSGRVVPETYRRGDGPM